MKKALNILKKIGLFVTLAILLSLTPVLTYAAENNTSHEDKQDTLQIRQPIVSPNSSAKDSPQKASAASNVGYVDVWVSGSPKRIYWNVVVNPPYRGNGFNGYINITDLNSGLSHGNMSIAGMKGSISTPILRSRYGARISGVLTYNGVTTGVTMESPYLTWTNY